MNNKLIGINGSPHADRTTSFALNTTLNIAKEIYGEGLETEIIDLGKLSIKGCKDCGHCKKELGCSIKDDFTDLIPVLNDAHLGGIVMASPVYMGSMTSQLKAFIDRTVMFRRNNFIFQNIIGGAITVGGSRNGGQELTIQNIQAAMMIHDMIIVGDGRGSAHFGGTLWSRHEGGIEKDVDGITTAENLGKRMAYLIEKISS